MGGGFSGQPSGIEITSLTLNGTGDDTQHTYTINSGTIEVKAVVPQPQVVTVNFLGTPNLEVKNGELNDSDIILLEAPPDGLSNASNVHVAVKKESGGWKVEGEFTLPSGSEFTQTSLTWSDLKQGVKSGATINSVTLTASSIGGSASEGYTFVATGGSVDITPAVPIDEHAVVITILGSLVAISGGEDLVIGDEFNVADAPNEFSESATFTDVDFKKSTDDGKWEVHGTIILNPGTEVTTETLTWETLNVKGSISDTVVNGVTLNGTVVTLSDYNYRFEIAGTSGGTIDAGQSNLVKLNITTSGETVQYSGTDSLLSGDIIDLTENPNVDGDSLKDISVSTRIKLETKDSSQHTESVSGYIMLKAGTEISSISGVKTISWDNLKIDPSSKSWLRVNSVTFTGSVDVESSTFTVKSVTITTGESLGNKGEVIIEFPTDGLVFTTVSGSVSDEQLYDILKGHKLELTTRYVHGGTDEFKKGGAIDGFNLYLEFGENGKVSIESGGLHKFNLKDGYTGIIRDIIPIVNDAEFKKLDLKDKDIDIKLGHIHGVYLHGHQELNKWIVDGIKLDIPKLVQVGENEMELSTNPATVSGATPSNGETLTVDLTEYVSDGSATGTITINFSSGTSATVSSSDLAVSNLELGKEPVEIEASNPSGWPLGSDESIERVKLSGTYETGKTNGMTLTINNIELTPKASE